MNGNNTNDEILNNEITNTIQNSFKQETTDNQQEISVNNNELVIYQDVDGEYKTFMLSPQQMAELEILVQTSPTFQSVPSQCSVINTVQNPPPQITTSGVQLMASSFEPISLSQVNNFTSSNTDNVFDTTSPQYTDNKPKNSQAILYRNTEPTIAIAEPYFSNPLLLPGTVLLNNGENLKNILQVEKTMNIVTDNGRQSTINEDKPTEVVSLTSFNTTEERSGKTQTGLVNEKTVENNTVHDVIKNINMPIKLQTSGNLLPVRIANGNITKITESAASHTIVRLLKTGQSFHSMEHLDSEKLKAVETAINSVGNVAFNKNYTMFDRATKTRIIYRLVYPEDLKLFQNIKARKGRPPRQHTDTSAAQSTEPQQVKVTRCGRAVRVPRHIDGTGVQAPLSTAPMPRKKPLIFPCAHCSKHFRGQKRLEQHYQIHPQHRPPEVIKPKPQPQPITPKLVNLQPANLKPANPQPANPQSASQSAIHKPTNSQPINPQPANTQPANPEPADSQPAILKPTNPQLADPQPANPECADSQPAIPKSTNSQPTNPQSANPQLANPQPANPQPANQQPAQEPESQPADKNLNLFECLLNILDKTTKENRAMVFVQQLETLLVRLRSLMPCMIGARVRRHGSLCSINKELGRVFDVSAGNYTLDMDALKCTKDIDGICHHLSAEIIVDDLSDDCINTDILEVPCSRTHSVEDWPLANKRVWNTRVKTNTFNTNWNGGSLSDVRNKVRLDYNLRYNIETNPLLNVTEKEKPSWPSLKEEVITDSKITSKNKDIADPESPNSTVVGFRDMEDDLIGMFTYNNENTQPLPTLQSLEPVNLDEVSEQNINDNYQIHSSNFNIPSSPIRGSSGSMSKIQMQKECLPTFVKLAEQERSFSLPDVIKSVADSTKKITDSGLQSIPVHTQAINDLPMVSSVHSSDRNNDIKVITRPIEDYAMSEESSDLNVSPTQLSGRKRFNSTQKFTLDDLQDDLVNNELNRINAYITHKFTDVKSTSMENHLASEDSYISKIKSTDTKSKTNKSVEKGKKRRKIKKSMEHNNLEITKSYLSNTHLAAQHTTKNTIMKSDSLPEKNVNDKLNKTDSFLSNMYLADVIQKEKTISDSLTKVKRRKTKKKSADKDHNPTDLFLSNIHCSSKQISNNVMISNTLSSEKRHHLKTKLGKTDPIMASIHQTGQQSKNSELDETDLYLSNIHSPDMSTSGNTISAALMKEHRPRNILDDEIDRADSYLTNIHSSHEQIRKHNSISKSFTKNKSRIKNNLDATDLIFSSMHSSDVQMRTDLTGTDLARTDSYLANIHVPNLQMSTDEVVIANGSSNRRGHKLLVSNDTNSFLSNINSLNTHMSRNETVISDSCTNENMQRNSEENDRDRTDSYLLNVLSKRTKSSNDVMIANNLTDRELKRHLSGHSDVRTDSIYSHGDSSDDHGNNQRSLVDTDVDRAEAFLANMHSSDAQMSSNETDSMSEVKMTQNEGLLSVNESSLDSGRLSSLQLLDLSLSFTDAASSQMSLDLPLDLFPYHHP